MALPSVALPKALLFPSLISDARKVEQKVAKF